MVRILTVIALLTIASCGKEGGNSSSKNVTEEKDPPPIQLPNEGNYRSVLKPINTLIKDNEAFGTTIINIEEDVFSVELHLTHIPKSRKYFQTIHTQGACPTERDDTNSDSYIDLPEGMASLGKILIPLDGDVSTQTSGNEYFASSTGVGNYSYQQDSLLSSVLNDLHEPDEDLHDDIIKLSSEDYLNLEKRTIVISVVEKSDEMTEGISLLDDQSAEAFIPVACGEIVRINSEE